MDLEKLIEAVRKYECLYDVRHRKYMDTKYKNTIWEKVGAEVGYNGETCKTRWTNMRDTYRKSLKKSSASGQSAKKVMVYKYHDQLQFLIPFLTERPTTKNNESDVSEECDNEIGNQESSEIVEPAATVKQEQEETMPTPLTSPESSQSTSSVYLRPPKRARRIISKSCSQPTAVAVGTKQVTKPHNTTEDPVDAFLLGAIAPILKSLPRYEQALAKSELFSVAQKYEFQSITGDTVRTSADSRSSTNSVIFGNAPFD